MSTADDLLAIARHVQRNEDLIAAVGLPIISLIREAVEGGVSHDSIVAAIKAEMVAASKAEMKAELGP